MSDFYDRFVLFIAETYDIRPSEARAICFKAMDLIKQEVAKIEDTATLSCDGCKLKEECEHMRQYKGELPHDCPRF